MRSPRMPSSGSSLTRPGRSSSMGKASTSVGPSPSIHFSLRPVMVSSSTALMHSSARGCTRIRSSTNRLRSTSRLTSSGWPDSLRTSILMASAAGLSGPALLVASVVLLVGRDDLADQLVTDHVVGGEPVERQVLHTVEDLLDDPQARAGARRQVDLRHVTGDHDLGAEPQPGQEHLHLLGRG